MFRKRRPLRPLRPPRPGAPPPGVVGPRVREALFRAHRALEQGDTARAAQIFHRLARGAARRGMVLRAAGLLLEAAYAEALGGEARRAADDALRALEGLADRPLPERVAATAERVAEALRKGGHTAEAEEVEQALEGALERAGTSRREVADRFARARAGRQGTLPAKCPSCGGPLLPDELAWHGPDTAECPYCGSVVKAV